MSRNLALILNTGLLIWFIPLFELCFYGTPIDGSMPWGYILFAFTPLITLICLFNGITGDIKSFLLKLNFITLIWRFASLYFTSQSMFPGKPDATIILCLMSLPFIINIVFLLNGITFKKTCEKLTGLGGILSVISCVMIVFIGSYILFAKNYYDPALNPIDMNSVIRWDIVRSRSCYALITCGLLFFILRFKNR
jgi:hypothetical protein